MVRFKNLVGWRGQSVPSHDPYDRLGGDTNALKNWFAKMMSGRPVALRTGPPLAFRRLEHLPRFAAYLPGNSLVPLSL